MVARHWRSPEVVEKDVRDGGGGGGGAGAVAPTRAHCARDVGIAEDGLDVVVHKVTFEAVGHDGPRFIQGKTLNQTPIFLCVM